MINNIEMIDESLKREREREGEKRPTDDFIIQRKTRREKKNNDNRSTY